MKLLAVILFLSLGTVGCSGYYYPDMPVFEVSSSFPIRANTLTVVNGSDSELGVLVDGRLLKDGLRTGEHFALDLYGTSRYSRRISVAVIARGPEGELAGSAQKSFSVNSRRPRSETWIVRERDLRL